MDLEKGGMKADVGLTAHLVRLLMGALRWVYSRFDGVPGAMGWGVLFVGCVGCHAGGGSDACQMGRGGRGALDAGFIGEQHPVHVLSYCTT